MRAGTFVKQLRNPAVQVISRKPFRSDVREPLTANGRLSAAGSSGSWISAVQVISQCSFRIPACRVPADGQCQGISCSMLQISEVAKVVQVISRSLPDPDVQVPKDSQCQGIQLQHVSDAWSAEGPSDIAKVLRTPSCGRLRTASARVSAVGNNKFRHKEM